MKDSTPRPIAARVSDTPRLQLRRTEKYSGLLGLLDETNDYVVITNLVGEMIFANRAIRAAMGYSPEEFADLMWFDLLAAGERDEIKGLVTSVVDSDQGGDVKLSLHCKSGRTFVVEGVVTPRREANGVTGSQWVLRPLTAGKKDLWAIQRQGEQQIAENKAREEQLKELRANFISMAS